MLFIGTGKTEVDPAKPAARRVWISICIVIAMIAITGCLPTRFGAPTEERGAEINQFQTNGSGPAVNQEAVGRPTEALSRSTSTPDPVHPLTITTPDNPRVPPPTSTSHAETWPPPIVGGADKIAYLYAHDIWVANLDGSELTRLTYDGRGKANLQWSTDGQAVTYIADDRCYYRLHLEDRTAERLVCLPFAQYFRAYEVSPDGMIVALSIDNWLYVLPNDLALLNALTSHSDLTENAVCEFFDPLEKDPDHRIVAKFTRWSDDGRRLAFVTHSADRQVGDVSIVRVLSYDDCQTVPRALSYFPAWHLLPDEYRRFPALSSFGWDGDDLFFFVAKTDRESGLGGLFSYDINSWKLTGPVLLITDCCYRDPSFSPDGSHLLLGYQAEQPDGDLRLYIVPVAAVGDRAALIPLPLPGFSPLNESGAVLRPALSVPDP
ncbi:MAG: hypothetical protein A2W35_21725 [Chloroflexi bacterium RBG_16_57_11]|nr:MAG: hypothetical protein A2W35_21725 [Chloroflexi bacterium RBG_16_57_11]